MRIKSPTIFSKLFATSLLTLFLVAITPALSFAHAELEKSNPVDGAALGKMPQAISLTFGEELLSLGEEGINTLTLKDPNNAEVTLDSIVVKGSNLSAGIPAGTEAFPSGKYLIQYRVVSTDGHPVKGEIAFELTGGEVGVTTSSSPQIAPDHGSESSASNGSGINFALIFPILVIILVIGALLIVRKKK